MSRSIPRVDYDRYFGENAAHPLVFPDEDGYTGDGEGPVCKVSGEKLQQIVIGRSIWLKPFSGGGGEVRQVAHLSCGCELKREPPSPGTPIYEEDLADLP